MKKPKKLQLVYSAELVTEVKALYYKQKNYAEIVKILEANSGILPSYLYATFDSANSFDLDFLSKIKSMKQLKSIIDTVCRLYIAYELANKEIKAFYAVYSKPNQL